MDTTDIAKQLGKLGGEATSRLHGKEHYSLIGRKGSMKRWHSKRLLVTEPMEEETVQYCTICHKPDYTHDRYSTHKFQAKN